MVDGASQLLKSLQRLHWPESVNLDTAVYLGAVCYQAEDSLLKVQEEAELARHLQRRLQDHAQIGALVRAVHKGAVDLQLGERDAGQLLHR